MNLFNKVIRNESKIKMLKKNTYTPICFQRKSRCFLRLNLKCVVYACMFSSTQTKLTMHYSLFL